MKALLSLTFGLLLSLSACSKKDSAPAPLAPGEPSAIQTCPAGSVPQAESKDAKDCGAVFNGCCFADGAAACAAAGCGDQCLQKESYPVQVACPDAKQ